MLSLVLTIAVLPVGAWARRHGWPNWLATLFALVTAYAILVVLLVGTIICLVKLVDLLPQYTKDAQGLTDQIHDWLSRLGLGTETTSDALKKVDPGKVADLLSGVLSGILGALGGLFFLVTVMFFFIVAVRGIRAADRLAPGFEATARGSARQVRQRHPEVPRDDRPVRRHRGSRWTPRHCG